MQPLSMAGPRFDRSRWDAPSVAVVAFYSLGLVAPAFVWVPLLVGATVLSPGRQSGPRVGRPIVVVMAAALVFALGGVVPFLTAPVTPRGVVSVVKLAIVPLLALTVWRLRDRDVIVPAWIGCSAGAVLAGATAVVQVSWLGMVRAEGMTGNAITFGDIALTLGALSLGLCPLVAGPRPFVPLLSATAMGMGLVACTLSGSRGAWLAIPVVAGVVTLVHRRSLGGRGLRLVGLGVVLVVGLAITMGRGMPLDRAGAVVGEVTEYVDKAPADDARATTVGARIEAWRSALAGFRTDPLLGIGWGNLPRLFDRDVALGARNPRIATFDHAHNQFIDAMANGGLVGLTTTLAIFVAPAWVFFRARRSGGPTERTIAASGLLVVGCFFVFAQTEASFQRLLPTCFYAITVSALACMLTTSQGAPGHSTSSRGLGLAQAGARDATADPARSGLR